MRSRLLLPIETVSVHLQLLATPFINKSLRLGSSELLPKNNKQNLYFEVFLPLSFLFLCSLLFFF